MPRLDFYKGLDADSKLRVELSMTEVAKEICSLNYGAHRILSALSHELRKKQREYVDKTREDDRKKLENQRLNLTEADMASPLADAIEEALNKGFYY